MVKEKLKTEVTRVKKECDVLRDVNMTTVKALEWETKRARQEEWSRNMFRGALWGSSNELKLRKAERDKSREESMVLTQKVEREYQNDVQVVRTLEKLKAGYIIFTFTVVMVFLTISMS